MFLILNVFSDYVGRYFVPYASHKVPILPYHPRPHGFTHLRKFLEYLTRRYALHYLYYPGRSIRRRRFHEHMHVILHYLHRVYTEAILLRNLPEYLLNILPHLPTQNMRPILRHPYHVVFQIVDGVLRPPYSHTVFISPTQLVKQASLLRLPANRFPPLSKLGGIQRAFL